MCWTQTGPSPQANVTNTPLGPYLDKELLYNNSLSVSNEKIKAAGFAFAHPTPTVEVLHRIITVSVCYLPFVTCLVLFPLQC